MTRLRAVWDRMRGTYWAVPSAMAAVAIVAALVMIDVDEALTAELLNQLSWVYTGGAEGARAVLSTIAASMITVAGVTFSITIVALTLASQQFGPRLLRNFLRDLGNQITLGTFIATFLYCLLVLRTVRGTDDDQFVPHLAVTVGVVLATLSIGVLIYFIHHIATSIQASQVIANVASDLHGAIERLFPERIGHEVDIDTSETRVPDFQEARPVVATHTGYVQAVDSAQVLAAAREGASVVRIDARPGDFVRAGRPLASVVWSAGKPMDVDDDALRRGFIIGADRTGTQDVGFFINQLVELGVRALSPGINDPATARACIDRLEDALGHLSSRQMPSPYRYDEDNVLRIVARPVTFAETLDLAFTELSRYGSSSVSVSCRLLEAIRDLAPCLSRDEDRRALARQADLVGDRTGSAAENDIDRAQLASCRRNVLEALQDVETHFNETHFQRPHS
jgi:uncharacterized membrane protein